MSECAGDKCEHPSHKADALNDKMLEVLKPTTYELTRVLQVPAELKAFEIAWFRISKSKKWNNFEALKKKEAFREGWNSAVFLKADFFVVPNSQRLTTVSK